MEHIRYPKNWTRNSPKYKKHLSPFGRKVMAALFQLKDEPKNMSCKLFYPEPQSCYEYKRVFKFNATNSPKSSFFYKQTPDVNIRDVANTNFHMIDSLPHLSISSKFLNASKDDSNLKETSVKINFSQNNSYGDLKRLHNSYSSNNNKVINQNLVNIGFHPVFDINDIFECVDGNKINKSTENQLDTEELRLNNVAPENKIKNDHNINVNCNIEKIIALNESGKRKNIRNIQCFKDKKSKIIDTIHEKETFRKDKYKTVKNWLSDVQMKNKEEGDRNNNKLPSKVFQACQSKLKNNKKVIQSQLTNKDGVMKYSKPKKENHAFEKNQKESIEMITESTGIKKSVINKERKRRAKFIAPIKSQIPVKEIEYPINVINDNDLKEFENKFNAVENEEILIILVFRNGFCQLNSQHTDDACIPEAILFSVHDTFYYLKGVEPCIMNAFCRLVSNNTLICYDAKMIFLYLYNNLEGTIKISVIFDAKIGGGLISPDEPPETFSNLQKLLSITPDYMIVTECELQKTAWYMTLLKESARKLRAMMIDNGVYNLFVNIEMKILPIITDMERKGICVNVTKLKFMEGVLMSRMKDVEAQCHAAAGKPFQINSTLQVRTILYDELKLDTKCNVKIFETVSKGAKSTSENMLRSLSDVHPLPRLILEYRHLHKAYATFVAGVARHVTDGVVKPTWDQMAAVTGRIASKGPNLQATPGKPFDLVQFPTEDETEYPKLKFRSVYTSRAGHCLLAADFKHLECRVLAHAARDRALADALRARDLFTVLAAKWLSKSEGAVSNEDRSLTKRLVYASLYGAGARTLGDMLQGTDGQLLGVIDSFNNIAIKTRHPTDTFPSLKNFGKCVVSECVSRGGRLTTPSGRGRTFKNLFSKDFSLRSQAERQAVNFIIQGTAADLCKRAMLVAHERLGSAAHLLLQLHDELVWEVPRPRLRAAAAIIKSAMESCGREFGLALDLPVAIYCGDNWGEMEAFTPCDTHMTTVSRDLNTVK